MSGEDMGAVKLVTTADISLKEHVGHQVQVTGTMSGASGKMKDKSSSASSDTTGSGSSASPSSATGTSGAEKGKEGAHTLRVRALRHVSETCSK